LFVTPTGVFPSLHLWGDCCSALCACEMACSRWLTEYGGL
jgi:hypothetical protein